MSDVHKCVIITVGNLLGFRPGNLVLDWGSGCGHKLSWAKMLFDVNGLGLDVEAGAVDWARSHSAGKFCHADGRDLKWIPDGMFDFVISYAALYHLSVDEQCNTGIQLVEKLRIGGRAFFGWNHVPVMNHWEWRACFRNSQEVRASFEPERAHEQQGVRVELEALEDYVVFPPENRAGEDGRTPFLYQNPAYSIFITRIA